MNGDSYINNNVPFFADKDDIMKEIVNKRTQVEKSPATKYENEDDGKLMITDAAPS